MRSICIAVTLAALAAAPSALLAQQTPPKGLSGSWLFTWADNPNNVNAATLKYEAGTITGTYLNDAKESCPLVGRMPAPDRVVLTIMCPKWDIRTEGLISNDTVVGTYVAYGNANGTFKMVRSK